jgi:hypothetical protein
MLDTAYAELRRDHDQGPPVWHALAAVAAATTDIRLAEAHLDRADAAWDRFGALAATAHLVVHHAAPGGTVARLREAYPVFAERRRSLPADPARLPTRDVAAAAVVVRADRDLAEVALLLGYSPEPFEAWAEAGAGAVDRHLWVESAGTYGDPASPWHGATALFASIPDRARAERVALAVHSAQPGADLETFPARLLALAGLRRYGFDDTAAVLAESLLPALRDGLAGGDSELRHRSAVAAILALSPLAW